MAGETSQNTVDSIRYGPIDPPSTIAGALMRIGPGLIIAGSIVGSGELIATTKVGAETGFWLLWLVIIGCVIKVFAQIEFGRYTVTHAETPLKALDSVPGPRLKVNWIVWYWAIMTMLIISQQGGIVGGIGQALAISMPLTEEGRRYNRISDEMVQVQVNLKIRSASDPESAEIPELREKLDAISSQRPPEPPDPYLWAAIVAIVTSILLYVGRYRFIQSFSTVLVVGFTIVTVLTVVALQSKPDWAVTGGELARGLSFRLPPASEIPTRSPLATALGAFGIIGVGASELIAYPYWCLEKGYARFTGPRDGSAAWTSRARGWMRVMHTDAWASMVVYTIATLAFFLLGAAVLGRVGLNPKQGDMVRTLAQMYVPVFGPWAHTVFLVGAFAVLYSTFFVAAAGNSRIVADSFGMFGVHDGSEAARMRWTRIVSTIWPLGALTLYVVVKAPAAMVLLSGVAQAVMLPMLGVAALYFRYRRCDPGLCPGRIWDVLLWISFAGLLIAGSWAAISKLQDMFPGLFE